MKKRPADNGALPPQTLARSLWESVPDTPVTTAEPRWTGCPMGCGQYGHEPPCPVGRPLRLSCHACGALDWSTREALDTCCSACPARAVA